MSENNSFRAYLNPIVAIAVLILSSVLILIGSAIVGLDKGVLAGMAKVDFARGLITYLFAVVTIGTAVVLVVSALTGAADEHNDRQFQRGKEILSLLLGVFGTIVGFYFGSEVSASVRLREEVLSVLPIRLSSLTVAPNDKFTITTFVSGGQPPYRYGVGVGGATPDIQERVDESGWITKELTAPTASKLQSVSVSIQVKDANGHITQQSTKITVKPPD